MADRAEVEILMAVRNGMPHLPAQLASFAAQQHGHWSLLVGDDGSGDGSPDCIAAFAAARPRHRVEIVPGPATGNVAANFLALLARSTPGRFLAFSDQDDVWMPHRLGRGLAQLQAASQAVAIYAGRTLLTDAALAVRRPAPFPTRGAWFGNALVQNVLAGNTLLLSPAAAALLRRTVPAALQAGVPFHDWWIYQVIAGSGGAIVLDPEPTVLYRQHSGNMLGTSRGLQAGLMRMGRAMGRHYSGWIDRNLAALRHLPDLLTPEAQQVLDGFSEARTGPPRLCWSRMQALEIRRQTRAGDRALAMLARMGRL